MPEAVKQERWEEFMTVAAEISRKKLQKKIGKTLQVLVDEVDDEGAIARSSADAPEIDGKVFIGDASSLRPGMSTQVLIEEADDYDLYGSLSPS